MGLQTYWEKRNFDRTAEPRGRQTRLEGRQFVVQKHAARRLHYDFRLELGGVLLSWAVPKGPSLDPEVKRLAMQTEDHPVDYGEFEGVIPEGEYGGGTVLLWDRGSWQPEGDPDEMYRRGRLTFVLQGQKLRGKFHLVRTAGGARGERRWLLFKGHDEAARPGSDAQIVEAEPTSVASGRDLDGIAGDPDHVWTSRAAGGGASPRSPRGGGAASHAGLPLSALARRAPRAELPAFLEPQLATLSADAPEGDDWLHEIKLDGYRILARVEGGHAQLLSRRGHDWTTRLPSIASALGGVPADRTWLDGEVVVLRPDGVSDFQQLQNSMEAGRDVECVYFAFDAPFLGGLDLRQLPLAERKEQLRQVVAGLQSERVRFGDHIRGGGPAFFARACSLGLEGIVSKRADAAYVSGRGHGWLKVKCLARQEFVIGGFTEPAGSRRHFGALLLGLRDGERLVYAGKVGTGFTRQSLAALHERLLPLVRGEPPFADPPSGAERRGVRWVEPRLVAEVAFVERTREGMIRHASFQGLREDKAPEEVAEERPAAGDASAGEGRLARDLAVARRAEPPRGERQRRSTRARAEPRPAERGSTPEQASPKAAGEGRAAPAAPRTKACAAPRAGGGSEKKVSRKAPRAARGASAEEASTKPSLGARGGYEKKTRAKAPRAGGGRSEKQARAKAPRAGGGRSEKQARAKAPRGTWATGEKARATTSRASPGVTQEQVGARAAEARRGSEERAAASSAAKRSREASAGRKRPPRPAPARSARPGAGEHLPRAEQPGPDPHAPSAASASEPASRAACSGSGGAAGARRAAALPPAIELDVSRLEITNPDRVLFPEQGITKRELLLHYARAARWMLPQLSGRPLMLVRCPEGTGRHCFHQKHPSAGMPRAVQTVTVPQKKGPEPHLMIRDVEGLLGLVQMGALEIHAWGCRAEHLDCPDQLVFDLDPDVGLPWPRVVEAALTLRADLERRGLTGFLRVTGGKGLHVVVPVEPVTPWPEAKEFTKRVAEAMVRAEPDKYLAVMTKQKRRGKIFIDYLRNGFGATAVASYSTRARAGAPVAVPVGWDELIEGIVPDQYSVNNLEQRLRAVPDPWACVEEARAPIPSR